MLFSFSLTLPDTRTLLVAHLPAQLLWAVTARCWAQQSHHSPLAAAPFKWIAFPRGCFPEEQWGEMGRWACRRLEGVGMVGSGQGERPSRERRETGEPWERSMAAKPWVPRGHCFGFLCPESHTFSSTWEFTSSLCCHLKHWKWTEHFYINLP